MTLRSTVIVLPPNLYSFIPHSPGSSGASTPLSSNSNTELGTAVGIELGQWGEHLLTVDEHPEEIEIPMKLLVNAALTGALLASTAVEAKKQKKSANYVLGAGMIALGIFTLYKNMS